MAIDGLDFHLMTNRAEGRKKNNPSKIRGGGEEGQLAESR